MIHEPPPRPLRTLSRSVLRVMEAGGRFLLWLGPGLLVILPVVWLLNPQARDEVLAQGSVALLLWGAMAAGWHIVLVFLRWWMWWHRDERG